MIFSRQNIKERVESVIRQMTLEEKVAQMIQIPYANEEREKALQWAKLGAGSFLHVFGDDAREVQHAACNSRLGIPVVFGIDAVRGHAFNDHATIFPTQLACACSWDKEIVEKMGRVTAREVATDRVHWTFSPVLCLSRDSRWGRVDETFGEDSYLVGELAAAMIKGYQGDSLEDKDSILACAKHYIAYGEAIGARDACDSEITYRKVREVFLPPFRKAVDVGCATIMTAYGSIDGLPLTINEHALKDILRDELGFEGFVVTDWNNVGNLIHVQSVAKDMDEATLLTANAGNDLIMSCSDFYDSAIRLVRQGALKEDVINEAVRHILTIKMKMGLFERPEKLGIPGCIGCDEHQNIALEAARRSVTLLKNDGVLPIKKQCKKIAVIGGNADDIRAQYGDWTYFTHPQPDPEHEPVRPYSTVKEGIEKLALANNMEFVYAKGCGPIPSEEDDLDAAILAARDADVIIHVVGDMVDQVGEWKDRANLELSGRQNELFERLCELNLPIITVLVASKPLALVKAKDCANAVVIAFNGGAHGGQAVAEAIFGEYNPSGRLPISFPRHSGQTPVYYNYLPGWHGEARYCDLLHTPLFAFGEGLSYTEFTYSDLTMNVDTMTATVKVTNSGNVSGLETVQVYFRDIVSSVMTPVKQLIAYQQVTLEPGETRNIEFVFDLMDFSLVNREEQRVFEPGKFALMVGHSSKDEDLLMVDFEICKQLLV